MNEAKLNYGTSFSFLKRFVMFALHNTRLNKSVFILARMAWLPYLIMSFFLLLKLLNKEFTLTRFCKLPWSGEPWLFLQITIWNDLTDNDLAYFCCAYKEVEIGRNRQFSLIGGQLATGCQPDEALAELQSMVPAREDPCSVMVPGSSYSCWRTLEPEVSLPSQLCRTVYWSLLYKQHWVDPLFTCSMKIAEWGVVLDQN